MRAGPRDRISVLTGRDGGGDLSGPREDAARRWPSAHGGERIVLPVPRSRLPASRTAGNGCPLVKPPDPGDLLQEPERTRNPPFLSHPALAWPATCSLLVSRGTPIPRRVPAWTRRAQGYLGARSQRCASAGLRPSRPEAPPPRDCLSRCVPGGCRAQRGQSSGCPELPGILALGFLCPASPVLSVCGGHPPVGTPNSGAWTRGSSQDFSPHPDPR